MDKFLANAKLIFRGLVVIYSNISKQVRTLVSHLTLILTFYGTALGLVMCLVNAYSARPFDAFVFALLTLFCLYLNKNL